MVTFQKYMVYILSSILMGMSIILLPEISNSLAPIYAFVISAFIGIDIISTIQKTKSLPEGEYKKIKRDRYISTAIVSSILVGIALVVDQKGEVRLLDTITLLSMTLMSIGALYITALETNKIFTGSKPVEINPESVEVKRLND